MRWILAFTFFITLPAKLYAQSSCSARLLGLSAAFDFRHNFQPQIHIVNYHEKCNSMIGNAPLWNEGNYANFLLGKDDSEALQMFSTSQDLGKWCPNFNSIPTSEKRRASLIFFKSLAQIESSCIPNKTSNNATNGIAYGLFQLEEVAARLNAGRPEECYPQLRKKDADRYRKFINCSLRNRNSETGIISKRSIDSCANTNFVEYNNEDLLNPEDNAICAKAILKKNLAKSDGVLFGKNQYWQHLRKEQGGKNKFCGGAIGAFTRASLLQVKEAKTCFSNINEENNYQLIECLNIDKVELKSMLAAKSEVKSSEQPPTKTCPEGQSTPCLRPDGGKQEPLIPFEQDYLDNISKQEISDNLKALEEFLKNFNKR